MSSNVISAAHIFRQKKEERLGLHVKVDNTVGIETPGHGQPYRRKLILSTKRVKAGAYDAEHIIVTLHSSPEPHKAIHLYDNRRSDLENHIRAALRAASAMSGPGMIIKHEKTTGDGGATRPNIRYHYFTARIDS